MTVFCTLRISTVLPLLSTSLQINGSLAAVLCSKVALRIYFFIAQTYKVPASHCKCNYLMHSKSELGCALPQKVNLSVFDLCCYWASDSVPKSSYLIFFLALLGFNISPLLNSFSGVKETWTTCLPKLCVLFFDGNAGCTTSSWSARFGFVRTVEQARVWILILELGKSAGLQSARWNSVDSLGWRVPYWTNCRLVVADVCRAAFR